MNNSIKLPYIRIKQRDEVFYVTKLNAKFLIDRIDLHFRDPYRDYLGDKSIEKIDDYLGKIQNKGIHLKSEPEGIQRRLQLSRINEIKDYLESSVGNFFPNSILLSVDVSKIDDFTDKYLQYEENETGYFELPDDIRFSVIDGQHRIAGLYQTKNQRLIDEFEFVAILLFNVSLSTAAKLFSDINGKQKPVNRSLIYDLYGHIDTKDFKEIRRFHKIALKFYTDEESPLFRQIKMLGIGKGAISQAFFIDYSTDAIRKTDLRYKSDQEVYTQLFYYFRAFQKIFPKDWPVPRHYIDYNELDEYSYQVLRERKSQLVKTNGFGAILRLFPEVYDMSEKTLEGYIKIIGQLKNKISWVQDPDMPMGTGKNFQTYLMNRMREILIE